MQFLPPFSRVLSGDVIHNVPVVSLVTANLLTIALAILGNWDLATVMFIYWTQSIIIGLFTAISLLTTGMARKWPSASTGDPTKDTLTALDRIGSIVARIGLSGFFVIHYGIFHAAYYEFIIESGLFGQVNLNEPGLWLSCGIFFANHLYSFIAHWNTHILEEGGGGDDFFAPYHRIIPMHVTIIFGSMLIFALQEAGIPSTMPVLVLFLLLKTYADVATHLGKHSIPGTGGQISGSR